MKWVSVSTYLMSSLALNQQWEHAKCGQLWNLWADITDPPFVCVSSYDTGSIVFKHIWHLNFCDWICAYWRRASSCLCASYAAARFEAFGSHMRPNRRVLYHTLVVATMSASVLVPGAVCLVCVHANDERCSAKICLRTRRISAYLKYLQVHGLI